MDTEREEEEEAFEYLDTESGRALLPEFEFTRNLLPQPARGTPALDGTPVVRAPEPAATNRLSAWPW